VCLNDMNEQHKILLWYQKLSQNIYKSYKNVYFHDNFIWQH